MSQQLISRNADLEALVKAGYELAVKSGHLVITNIPYVNSQGHVKRGTLVSVLELNAEETIRPSQHIAYFAGEHPCDESGKKIKQLEHTSQRKDLGNGLVVDHSFSCKPPEGYRDYEHKMTTYAELISGFARKIDLEATARTHISIDTDAEEAVFHYHDTASTRAGIAAITNKLALDKVGIVGLGGTGSYVLDLIAKTPIKELHLFDGDDMLQHSSFRAPGAPSINVLRSRPKKVDYYAELYAPMRKNIFSHPSYIDEDNAHQLSEMSFVFICIDSGDAKGPIVERLESDHIPFIDVGMGIQMVDDKLLGVVRVTTSTSQKRDHLRSRVGFASAEPDDIYAQNIQVAELNALNASLAVIKWKKIFGFYIDFEQEYDCNYTIDGNKIDNRDKKNENE